VAKLHKKKKTEGLASFTSGGMGWLLECPGPKGKIESRRRGRVLTSREEKGREGLHCCSWGSREGDIFFVLDQIGGFILSNLKQALNS